VIALWVLGAMMELVGGGSDSAGTSSSSTFTSPPPSVAPLVESLEVVDWNWRKDPGFGTDGAIIWNVQVKNNSSQYVEGVRVDLTTYDAAGKLVTSDFTYVDAIPPGGIRSEQSYADYYGAEATADVQIVSARAAR
jgi:hypothetical protein